MDIDSLPVARRALPRGNKRSAASMDQIEERADKDGDGKSKTGLQKTGKAVARCMVHVVIPTPNFSPRQQRRVANDAESNESDEESEETSAKPWVGRGKARSINIASNNYAPSHS
jgi:hypothetical protein